VSAGYADPADQAAPLDALLADAALGTVRRVIPGALAAKFAVALAPKATHDQPEAEQPCR
jgi:hypothetical protein